MKSTRIKGTSVIENITLMRRQRATERLVPVTHINIHRLEDGDLHQRIDPRAIQQAADVKGDGTGVESEQVRVFHQRPAALQELFTHRSGGLLMPTGEEPLETGRTTLLTTAVVGIVIVEHTREKRAFGQLFVDGTLLSIAVEFATCLSQQEI